jgi:hypothetical protein
MFDNLFPSASTANDPRRQVENLLGEIPEMRDATRFVKPAGLRYLSPPAIYFFKRARAWMIDEHDMDEEEAESIGLRVQRNLVGKKSLTAADPYLAPLRLFVVFNGGYIELPGEAEKARDTTTSDLKHKILFHGQEVFGKQGCQLDGHEGAYRLKILPSRREFRGKFPAAEVRAATLDEIWANLSKAIEQVSHLL